jgi:hypothetical protein
MKYRDEAEMRSALKYSNTDLRNLYAARETSVESSLFGRSSFFGFATGVA